ncbi:MAG: hypothetical protein ABIQ44_15965 [Chloroflexia bacterium]
MADSAKQQATTGIDGYQGGKRVFSAELNNDPYVFGVGYVVEVLPGSDSGAEPVYRVTMTHNMYGTKIISTLPVNLDFKGQAEAEAGALGFFEALQLHPAYANTIELGYIPQPVSRE